MAPSDATYNIMTTRSRRVQPRLKERAEQFLAKADPLLALSRQTPEIVPSRKRKLQDVDESEKPAGTDIKVIQGKISQEMLSHAKPTKKFSTMKSLDGEGEKKPASSKSPIALETHTTQLASTPESAKNSSKLKPSKESDEKRLKRYRKQAPQSFLQKLHRSQTQRMIVLKRARRDSEAFPQEEVELVGSTGNMYTVTIGQIPSCTCPDHQKGNECKHKVYVLSNVLKAPEHLRYQLAFLSSELREIFAVAPAIPTNLFSAEDADGKRKPVEGECPICYMDFDEEHNELVWCKAACGNNMHKSCFDQWAASQRNVGVKCVYCRTSWHVDPGDLEHVKQAGSIGVDGYVNVGEQFGISRARDYSTYHPFWVRRQFGTGW